MCLRTTSTTSISTISSNGGRSILKIKTNEESRNSTYVNGRGSISNKRSTKRRASFVDILMGRHEDPVEDKETIILDDTCSNNTTSSSSSAVSFSAIHIREYEQIVGDNPSVSIGVPISIGWSYTPLPQIQLQTYETVRPPRRMKNEMRLPSNERSRILAEWGVPIRTQLTVVEEVKKVQGQRMATATQRGISSKAEEMGERLCKPFKGLSLVGIGKKGRRGRKVPEYMRIYEKQQRQERIQKQVPKQVTSSMA